MSNLGWLAFFSAHFLISILVFISLSKANSLLTVQADITSTSKSPESSSTYD